MSNPVLERPNPSTLESTSGKSLVVIDASVPNYPVLASGVKQDSTVLLLHPQKDGVEQISRYLANSRGFTSLHAIAHGSPGCLSLGSTQLTLQNLPRYERALQQWSDAFSQKNFDLLLYGCDVAQGEGKAFVREFARLTGAKIAASESKTGSPELGGNWELEFATGTVTSPLAFTAEMIATYPAVLATFNVSTVAELITAINNANNEVANPGSDTIELAAGTTFTLSGGSDGIPATGFENFGGNNPLVNRGFSGLPEITSAITINGNNATITRGGTANFRIFYVDGEDSIQGNLTLNSLTISSGNAATGGVNAGDDGGGIFNTGTVAINSSIMTGNQASDDGGAIANFGTMTIRDSILNGNVSGDGGGAISNQNSLNLGGVLTIINTSLTGNQGGEGGAIRNGVNGELNLLNNTSITGNTATVNGGSIFNESGGTVNRQNTSISGNTGGATPNDVTSGLAPGTISSANIVINDGTNVIPDGQTAAIDFGTTTLGTALGNRTFTVVNNGTGNLVVNTITVPTGFTLVSGIAAAIAPGANASFVVSADVQTAGTFQGEIVVASNDGDNLENPYNFAIQSTVNADTVVTPPVVTPPVVVNDGLLTVDGNNIFTIGSNGGLTNLLSQVTSTTTGAINQISIFQVDDANGTISGQSPGSAGYLQAAANRAQVLFSALPANSRPNGFSPSDQQAILDGFSAGDRFAFFLQQGDTTLLGSPFNSGPQQLNVSDLGNGRFSLGFEDGANGGDSSFDDVVISLEQTGSAVPLGVGAEQRRGEEIIDFRTTASQISANFRLTREAVLTNFVGLYRIDDTQGTVNGIAPGQDGYAAAAIGRRATSVNLQVFNQQVRTVSGVLDGNALYAPFIIAGATPDEFLAQNPENQLSGAVNGSTSLAYFRFVGANPDGRDHVLPLGNNTFGFEDLPAGLSDFDYDDLIFQSDFAIA